MPENTTNPSSHAHKRRAAERASDLVLIEQWYLRGMGTRMIALKLAEVRPYRISRQMIQAELKKLDAMWKAEAIAMRDANKRKVLAEIDDCYREASEAWERSKQEAVRKMVEQSGKKKSASKHRAQTDSQYGDPRFLVEMRELRNQKIKLLGLDEPTSVEVTATVGTLQLSEEQALERIFGPDESRISHETSPATNGGNGG